MFDIFYITYLYIILFYLSIYQTTKKYERLISSHIIRSYAHPCLPSQLIQIYWINYVIFNMKLMHIKGS